MEVNSSLNSSSRRADGASNHSRSVERRLVAGELTWLIHKQRQLTRSYGARLRCRHAGWGVACRGTARSGTAAAFAVAAHGNATAGAAAAVAAAVAAVAPAAGSPAAGDAIAAAAADVVAAVAAIAAAVAAAAAAAAAATAIATAVATAALTTAALTTAALTAAAVTAAAVAAAAVAAVVAANAASGFDIVSAPFPACLSRCRGPCSSHWLLARPCVASVIPAGSGCFPFLVVVSDPVDAVVNIQ